MTKKTIEQLAALAPQSVNTFIDASIDVLKREADNQLKKIKDQKNAMGAYQSNVDNLMKRFQAEDSLFGKAAQWYGRLSWWAKLLPIIAIVAGCLVSLVLGAVMIMMYSTFALLFTEHYNASEMRNKRLAKDIVALEASLAKSVEHLSSIEEQLRSVLTSLCKMNVALVKDIADFNTKIGQLERQIQLFTGVSEQVSHAQETLTSSSASLSQSFTNATACFNGLNEAMRDGLHDFQDTGKALVSQVQALTHDHNALSTLTSQLDVNHMQITELTGRLDQFLARREAHVERHAAMQVLLDNSTTSVSRAEVNEILSHADETLERSRRQQQLNAEVLEIGTTQQDRAKTVAALLARAQNAIALSRSVVSKGAGEYTNHL